MRHAIISDVVATEPKDLNISIFISNKISIKISKVIKMIEIRRKLYKRGSSYETTIPAQLLFALDKNKKYNVVFSYDNINNKWYLQFEEQKNEQILSGDN